MSRAYSPLRATAFRGRSDASPDRASVSTTAVPPRPFGVERVDAWLGGGLRGDGVHEVFAATMDDLMPALGFAALMAGAGREGRSLLWLRAPSQVAPYGPGLAAMRINPDAVTLVVLPDSRDLLRAALDAVRTGAAETVLLEMVGRQPRLDLTATRRLVLAAAETGAFTLIVRAGDEPGPSAAHSRWRISAAPSTPLLADAPGAPVFDLTLLRYRGGREGLNILLEWNRDTASFREWTGRGSAAPLSGGMVAVAAGAERPLAEDRAA